MMSASLIKLETFVSAGGGATANASYTRDDLDLSYAEGLAEGLGQRRREDVETLRFEMARLSVALTDEEDRRQGLREDAVRSLAPILSGILDSIAPSTHSTLLEQALISEMKRLAQSTMPLRCCIACPPDVRELVDRALIESGATCVEIRDVATSRIELELEGGRIEFDPERASEGLRALINEIMEGPETWTH